VSLGKSPISGGRSVSIVRLRTKNHGVFFRLRKWDVMFVAAVCVILSYTLAPIVVDLAVLSTLLEMVPLVRSYK
jgi:hypothetical protein